MKKYILLIFACIYAIHLNAQNAGINFLHGTTWAEAVAKAKAENKLIFIDFYTQWCGPCLNMAQTVFSLPTVGYYYNQTFINLKIDAEEGEGITLAKKYGVRSYPTYAFIDPATEEIVHRSSSRQTPEQFIQTGKDANIPTKRSFYLQEQYTKGNRERAFLIDYINYHYSVYARNNVQAAFDELIKGAKMLLPDFDPRCIIRTFAGQRPVVLNNGNDFYIRESETVKGFIHAAGIQSPGIASSPAIAEYVRDLLANAGLDLKDKSDYNPYREPIPDFSDLSLEEQDALIKKDPAWGKIVCRCETVPEGEIIAAIHSTLGARTVEGVKRRTRAGMGRCQSGFCQYKVMQILSRELGKNSDL